MSTGLNIQQWFAVEKPIEPSMSGYAARGALGPGPSASIYGIGAVSLDAGMDLFQNLFSPASGSPPSTYPNDVGTFNAPLSSVAPVGVVMGTGWRYNPAYRQCEINATPAGNVDLVCTMDQGAPALTIGEKIMIMLTGFMQSGTLTVLQGGAGIAVNISAANWNAAVASPPGIGVYRAMVTAAAVGNTLTLRFPAGTLAQAQFSSVAIARNYADWTDFAGNAAQMAA
jgi:hypothetical protein